jgi:hypothetical protein
VSRNDKVLKVTALGVCRYCSAIKTGSYHLLFSAATFAENLRGPVTNPKKSERIQTSVDSVFVYDDIMNEIVRNLNDDVRINYS